MEFNAKKCSTIEFGKSGRTEGTYYLENEDSKRTKEKDLGITGSNEILFGKHINKINGETYNLLRNIKTAFGYIDEDMIEKLITTKILPKLEYVALV